MNLYKIHIRPTSLSDAAKLIERDPRNWKLITLERNCVSAHIEAPSLIEAVHAALSKCEGECYYVVKL